MSKEHSATGTPVSDTQDTSTLVETPNSDSIFGNAKTPVVEVLPVTPTAESEISSQDKPTAKAAAEVVETSVSESAGADASEAKESKEANGAKVIAKKKKVTVKPVSADKPVIAEGQASNIEADSVDAESTGAEPDMDPFKKLGLREDVYKAIAGFGYKTPTAIQEETVSVILTGRDVIGQAETGSGKTAAFAWPLLSKIDLKKRAPQILVLAPTRELAIQVSSAFEKYGSSMKGFKSVTIYGGQSYETQFRALDRGVHVVVGTPGRVMDHLNRGTLKLDDITTFVLDEADEMLRMGFIDDVSWVMDRLPEERQVLSFSATMPAPIRNIAKKYLSDPAHITIKGKTATAETIEQSYTIVTVREKLKQLKWLLETEETDGVIVFVKTRQTTNVVAEALAQDGLKAAALNGDIAQNQRERTVNRLKSGKIDVVVATDVAARGLDVKRISHVVNYDFPHDSEIYVHRIGRTGRAGRSGEAILFVEPKEKRRLGWLEKDTKQKIGQYKPKSLKEVNQARVDKFRDEILKTTAHEQVKFFRTLVESMVEKTEHSVETIAAAIAVMAQGSTPLLLTDEQGSRKGRKGKVSHSDQDKATYRIEVGRNHGVGPGNIVGAIANEGGFQNREIGRVKLFDNFSIVDLPADISADVLDILRNVNVGGKRLQIAKTTEKYDDNNAPRRSGRRSNNGSTNFVKRQRAERGRDNRGGGGYDRGKRSGGSPGYRGRKSISSSETFADAPKRRPSRGERPAEGGKSSSSPMRSKAASVGKPRAESSSKPSGGGRGGSKPKPARKYIKVRNRK